MESLRNCGLKFQVCRGYGKLSLNRSPVVDWNHVGEAQELRVRSKLASCVAELLKGSVRLRQFAMDDICLPVRFVGINENAMKAHLRYCAASLKPGDRVECLLCDAGVVIPLVKRVYQKKSPALDVLIRSGSIEQEKLVQLSTLLSAEGL
jgi:hypothetical protein